MLPCIVTLPLDCGLDLWLIYLASLTMLTNIVVNHSLTYGENRVHEDD